MHDLPTFLVDQKIHTPKKHFRRKLLNLTLLLSLGLGSVVFFYESPGQAEQVEVALISAPNETIVNIANQETVSLEEMISESPAPTENQVTEISSNSPSQSLHLLQTKVHNTLTHTICDEVKDQTECRILAAQLARLMAWFFDVNSSPRKGDGLTLIYEKPDDIESVKILKLSYESTLFDKTYHANFYKAEDMKYGAYFDQNGVEIALRIVGKESPIRDYIEITALPGELRKGRRLGHTGSDFKADVGTPVYSSFAGKVLRTQWNIRNNGYCIEIDHPSKGVVTRYLHMSRVKVKRGEYVQAGQQIGESGNTGRTFAPHLHFELLTRGKRKKILNPFDYKAIKTERKRLSPQEFTAYKQQILALDAS